MNKFEENRQRLDIILRKAEKEGMTEELNHQLLDLYKDASILVVLGPNNSVERKDSSASREIPDIKDVHYYEGTFRNLDFSPFFRIDELGKPSIEYEQKIVERHVWPCIRITWEDKVGLINKFGDEDFNKIIEAILEYFNSVLGANWYRWQFQVVKE